VGSRALLRQRAIIACIWQHAIIANSHSAHTTTSFLATSKMPKRKGAKNKEPAPGKKRTVPRPGTQFATDSRWSGTQCEDYTNKSMAKCM